MEEQIVPVNASDVRTVPDSLGYGELARPYLYSGRRLRPPSRWGCF